MGKSTYTRELADEICERLAEGEPLRQICRDDHMPAWRTVYDWISADTDFAARIARARDAGFDAIAEDIIDIADDGTNDWMEKRDKDGEAIGYQLNGEHVQRSKLRIEARLKLLAKWSPKYRENTRMELTGANGGPVQLADADRRARVTGLAALAEARRRAQEHAGEDDASDLV